jgi:alpha-tubulin suppressor-like RCC1 family protein
LSNVVAIAAGGDGPYTGYCLALREDGTIVAWGQCQQAETTVPGSLNNVVFIVASGYDVGYGYGLALKSDGTVVGWGNNWYEDFYYGQADVPPGLSNVVAIATRFPHSLALKSDGTVVGWGSSYQTGPLAGLSNIVAIAAGGDHDLALKSDGTVVAWGDDSYGQIDVPVELSNVVAVAAGQLSSLALRSDGMLFVWGGVIGPLQEDWASNIVAIAAGGLWGWDVNVALRNDGCLFGWEGWGPPGFLDTGEWFSVDLRGPYGIVGVAAGDHHILALRSDGNVITWGDNSLGQSDVPVGLSNVVAVAAGYQSSLALVADLRIAGIALSDQGPVIRFRTFAGQRYAVECSPDLSVGSWVTSPGGTIFGDGNDAQWTDATPAAETARFYRVKLLSP